MCYHVVSRILITLVVNINNKKETIEKILHNSPYQEFPSILVEIFSNIIILVIENRH